ncbi:MFS transporter [Desertifilum tharense]|uniref:MFS transporter n=1 Tax=unclassified Desertifilum TaxID=2621682 RepID=UPI001F525E06|nr:MFS transporter [Desertifilum tharense]
MPISKGLGAIATSPETPPKPAGTLSKPEIRSSLWASTVDGIFASVFSGVTGGVLLTNFLLELGASSIEIGLLSSIPMLVNFLQPVGAYIADRTTSRHWYTLSIFSASRLLWLVLIVSIGFFSWHSGASHALVQQTLLMILLTHILGALGSPSWVSWMAALVPHRLRGRYFGLRNSAANFTHLLCVPLFGFLVASWHGGTIQGYGVALSLAVVAGIISLCFQFVMADVNPQVPTQWEKGRSKADATPEKGSLKTLGRDRNFLIFLLYWGGWMFAVNLSAPFFNLYLLQDLHLDVRWVTIYSSLTAGANLLMLLIWGKLADRIGNRPLLVLVGAMVAIAPLLWILTGRDSISIWCWLPALNLLGGATWAAIDLCGNNIQMEISPTQGSSIYFAIAAAISGLGGAIGTTAGGFFVEFAHSGGLPALFALSAGVRLLALVPLFFIQEPKSRPLNRLFA